MYDIHTHFIPPEMLAWLEANSGAVAAAWERRGANQEPFLTVNRKWSFELKREFYEESLYFAAQDEAGVEHSLVSPIPQLFLYDFPGELTSQASRVYNHALASWVKARPQRLSALATVPLNDVASAVQELTRSVGEGLKGTIVGPGFAGKLLSDPSFDPFWDAANELGAIVFIHPLLNEDPRIQKNRMPNLIGVPWETTICALDLILTGHFDRFPGVKVLLAHGGGFLPYQAGRYHQGYLSWPAVRNTLPSSPQEYLKRFYYDNVLWHPSALAFLKSVVGEDRVLPGSDFPFDLKTWPPAEAVVHGVHDFLGI